MTFASRMMTGLGLVAGIGLMAPGLALAQTITPPPATGTARPARRNMDGRAREYRAARDAVEQHGHDVRR